MMFPFAAAVVQTQVSYLDAVSLAASVVSLVLAVSAVSLSIKFFRMSNEQGQRSIDAAKDIGASVGKLEKLSDIMHTQILKMVQDTLADYREHAWPNNGVVHGVSNEVLQMENAKLDEQRDQLIKQTQESVLSIVRDENSETRKEVAEVINTLASQLKEADKQAESVRCRRHILDVMRRTVELKPPDINEVTVPWIDIVWHVCEVFSEGQLQEQFSALETEGVMRRLPSTAGEPLDGWPKVVINRSRLSDAVSTIDRT